MIKIPPFVQELSAYKAGKPIDELAREKNLDKIVKLASAENPLGPSPKAVEAMRKVVDQVNRYGDPASYELVQAIAQKFGVQPNHVICGHGIDSLISYILNAFTTEQDEILTSEGTFMGIYVACRKMGRNLRTVRMKNYGFDLEAILEAISEKTAMIYLANPNNPTGTLFEKQEFEDFMSKVPDHIMVLLDEAYTAYASENPNYPNGLTYDYENMVVARTLSKVYGLAGLRVGFAVGPDQVIQALYKVKLPFEPNLLAQHAAMGALEDDEFIRRTIQLNKQSMKMLCDCLRDLEIMFVPSWTNFILLLFRSSDLAKSFVEECMNLGLILRHVESFGIPNGVRVNTGTMEETVFAIEVMKEVYQDLNVEPKSMKF